MIYPTIQPRIIRYEYDILELSFVGENILPKSVKSLKLSELEIENILCHVLETILVYEYPTPVIFSALTRLGIVAFLRGKGVADNIEIQAVDIFRQISEFALVNKHYEWFTDWSKKLVGMVREKKTEG